MAEGRWPARTHPHPADDAGLMIPGKKLSGNSIFPLFARHMGPGRQGVKQGWRMSYKVSHCSAVPDRGRESCKLDTEKI